MDFRSDNTAPAHPGILAAITEANRGPASSYGEDEWTKRVEAAFADLFGCKVGVFITVTGTAANAIALAAMTPPWGAVICHREAHIEADEAGAPEFYSGAKLVLVDGPHSKVTPDALEEALGRRDKSVHSVRPSALSITQATERGASYTADEIARLADIARRNGLGVHMDGARFANSLVFLGANARALTVDAGVDVMSFGATKNGALGAEAILVFDEKRVDDVARRRKRSGHLLSKHRYVAAQLLAYLKDGLWLENAKRANALALRIGEAAGDWLTSPVGANQVFIRPQPGVLEKLRAAGAKFYDWGPAGSGEVRLVVAWNQPEEEVERFCTLLRALRANA